MFEDDENCSVSTLNTSNLSNKNQDLIQLSLRPFSLIKPLDLNPLKILNFMKNEIIYNFIKFRRNKKKKSNFKHEKIFN